MPVLLGLATELERERDHALDRETDADALLEDDLLERAEQQESASAELLDEYEWTALGSVATFEKVLYDGEEYGTLAEPGTPEEWDFIGIPGILEPEEVSRLLRSRQAAQESSAVSNIRTINTAEVTYLSSNGGNYGTIPDLVGAGLLDNRFNSSVSGYTFTVAASGSVSSE